MQTTELHLIQFLPPAVVLIILVAACYYFHSRYVRPSRELRNLLSKTSVTIRSMSDGDEGMRRIGAAKVFQNTPLESVWKDFSKTLHTQTISNSESKRVKKSRLTVPVSYCFSVSAVIDRPLGVDYFKHLPGILTGIGIIGTFAGLLFGLSNFDASNVTQMNKSVAMLLAGVRDAFYASAAAITVAMVITHWEKLLYRHCLKALDELVDALNNLFEAGVGEEYLATLVNHSANSSDQAKNLKDELIQVMVPVIKQLETIQTQQLEGLGEALAQALNESNRRLASQLEAILIRQVKSPIEEMGRGLENRISHLRNNPQDLALKVIRARQQEGGAEVSTETL